MISACNILIVDRVIWWKDWSLAELDIYIAVDGIEMSVLCMHPWLLCMNRRRSLKVQLSYYIW